MAKRTFTCVRSALRGERMRLSSQAYPGDLAAEVLAKVDPPSLLRRFWIPTAACAVLGMGLTIAIPLLQSSNIPAATGPMASTPQPAIVLSPPVVPPQITPAAPEPPAPPTPTAAKQDKPKLPEIDRDLLPLQRTTNATWLASATPQLHQRERHSQLAEHPNPSKRLRASITTPTRRSIDRLFSKTRSLKPSTKPERTSQWTS